MKHLSICLLFASAFAVYDETQKVGFVTPEELVELDLMHSRRRLGYMSATYGGSCYDMAGFESAETYNDDFCALMEKTREAETVAELAAKALGECEEVQPRLVILKRFDQNWLFVTDNPHKAFDAMTDFLRDQHHYIDDKHSLVFTYTYTTRDGRKRTLHVRNDMDLHSAFELQAEHKVTELDVDISSVAPSSSPTTAHPTATPVVSVKPTASPTSTLPSDFLKEEHVDWVNSLFKSTISKDYKFTGVRLYSAAKDGMSSTIWHKAVDGKGMHACFYSSEYWIGGSFSAYNWASSGGYKYCKDCFLWIWEEFAGSYKYKKKVFTSKNSSNAVYLYSSYGPCFGGGHDLCMSSISSTRPYGYTNSGSSYNTPHGGSGYKWGGTQNFYPTDMECYEVKSTSG